MAQQEAIIQQLAETDTFIDLMAVKVHQQINPVESKCWNACAQILIVMVKLLRGMNGKPFLQPTISPRRREPTGREMYFDPDVLKHNGLCMEIDCLVNSVMVPEKLVTKATVSVMATNLLPPAVPLP